MVRSFSHLLYTLAPQTLVALVAASAKASHSETSYDLYWQLRGGGGDPTSEAGSLLISALCRADAPERALLVYQVPSSPLCCF